MDFLKASHINIFEINTSLGKCFYTFTLSIFVLFNSAICQNVFWYEYDLGPSNSGYDNGDGGVSYNSSEKNFYVSGRTDEGNVVDDPLLIKVNSAGQKIFVKQYRLSGDDSFELITHGGVTSDGGCLLYGTTDYNSGEDLLLLKTTSAGDLSWAKKIDISSGTTIPTRFAEHSSGGYLLTGSVGMSGHTDAFVVSISSDGGTINFAKAYGTKRSENSCSIIEHSSGKISFAGSTNVSSTVANQGWWVELNSTGAVLWSKSLGGSNGKPESFKALIETTANNYFVIGDFTSSEVTANSGFFAEFNSTTGDVSNKNTFQTSPAKPFSIACLYRTPDNNNYWIGGTITINSGDDDCLMIKTDATAPAPAIGYAIGDADNQAFTYGAVIGNDEFAMGGTERMGSNLEWRSSIIKAQSARRCSSNTVNFTTTSLGRAAADVTTTVTNLTVTITDITGAITPTDRTAATTATRVCLTELLPVSLFSFSGKAESNLVNLFWSTTSEENNDYFALERSLDGKTFSQIAKVNGAGNANTLRNYDFADESPLLLGREGEVYYRLSQTDFDGKRSDLGIVAAQLSNEEAGLSVMIQSNPIVTKMLSLSLFSPVEENVLLSIANVQGVEVYKEPVFMKKKENALISIDLHNLHQGIYFLTASAKNSSITRKFIIVKKE